MAYTYSRRDLISSIGVAAYTAAAGAQSVNKSTNSSRALVIAQIMDSTPGQLDVSRDFLIGSRAAWQEINAKGGINGQPVQHLSLEVDGSPGSLIATLDSIRKIPNCIALSGTSGDRAASQLVTLLRQEQYDIAHVAPWLQNAEQDGDSRTFPIFASRQVQISHALRSLSNMGVPELGAIYASEQEYTQYRAEVERAARALKIRLKTYQAMRDLTHVAKNLNTDSPRILLFIGGTPELLQFTLGMAKQAQQRYVVAMADINLQTMLQMGAVRHISVVATQVVPMVNSALPVVRAYRETLSRLFDEPATPQSLAGYIAARYTHDILSAIEGPPTRQTALLAFQKRQAIDVGGFRVSFDAQKRSGAYVTQSMITADGRLLG
jgi:ABC-type branched-subunit amino acid transport system substrate-binding protein